MSGVALSAILRGHNDTVSFWCPGCDTVHSVKITGPNGWTYNGNPEKPTFMPSVKVTWPAHPEAVDKFKEWRTERICHSFVTDGQIRFLDDCTHPHRGETLPLATFPEDWA